VNFRPVNRPERPLTPRIFQPPLDQFRGAGQRLGFSSLLWTSFAGRVTRLEILADSGSVSGDQITAKPRPNVNLSSFLFDGCNLVFGQAYYHF